MLQGLLDFMMCSHFFIQSSVNGRSTTPLSPLFVQQTIPGRLLNQSNQSVFPLNEESPSFLFCCCCRIASFCYRITMLSLISSRMSLRFSLNHSRSISSTFWSDARRCCVHRGDRIPDLIFFPNNIVLIFYYCAQGRFWVWLRFSV